MHHQRKAANMFPAPRFQGRFLLVLVGGSLLPLIASGGILYYFIRENYLLLIKYAALEPKNTELLMRELHILIVVIAFLFSGYLIAITIFGIIFSHRIAGAMYALKRAFRKVAGGEECFLRFRRRDEFQDVAQEFNRMVEALRTQGRNQQSVG